MNCNLIDEAWDKDQSIKTILVYCNLSDEVDEWRMIDGRKIRMMLSEDEAKQASRKFPSKLIFMHRWWWAQIGAWLIFLRRNSCVKRNILYGGFPHKNSKFVPAIKFSSQKWTIGYYHSIIAMNPCHWTGFIILKKPSIFSIIIDKNMTLFLYLVLVSVEQPRTKIP